MSVNGVVGAASSCPFYAVTEDKSLIKITNMLVTVEKIEIPMRGLKTTIPGKSIITYNCTNLKDNRKYSIDELYYREVSIEEIARTYPEYVI